MLEVIKSKWDDILDFIKNEFEISDVAFTTWLKPLKIESLDDNILTISAERPEDANYINRKYNNFFKVALSEMFGEVFNIKFVSSDGVEASSSDTEYSPSKKDLEIRIENAGLNPKYTFDSFVVGTSNNFAHAYALKVAEAPGEIYNPLFLYGGVGLGKTHLMQSIAHYIIEHNANAKVLYVSSETFTNELISSIRNENPNTVIEFRNKYRNIDVLLIDDIQFIIGKERCQEEFFHTFNALFESKKQIVISSDKHPKEMTTLEERLRSRFECGLSVDISSPEYETRMAILQKKTEIDNYEIDNSILQYIASNVVSNIRELEGALTKVVAYSKISTKPITLELAKDILKDSIVSDSKKEITCDLILEKVTSYYNVSVNDIMSSKKSKNITRPRHIIMYLCRSLTPTTQQNIAEFLHKSDHSTVINACTNIENELLINSNLRNDIEKLEEIIKQG